MSKLKSLIFAGMLFMSIASLSAETKNFHDYGFEQERMIIDNGEIFIISSFDSEDGVTVYSVYGKRLWETKFHAKILSWEVVEDLVIVFSKDRNGHKTYLTCLDRYTGTLLWQKP